jgi:hypothetical protein
MRIGLLYRVELELPQESPHTCFLKIWCSIQCAILGTSVSVLLWSVKCLESSNSESYYASHSEFCEECCGSENSWFEDSIFSFKTIHSLQHFYRCNSFVDLIAPLIPRYLVLISKAKTSQMSEMMQTRVELKRL